MFKANVRLYDGPMTEPTTFEIPCTHWKENLKIIATIAGKYGVEIETRRYAAKQNPAAILTGDRADDVIAKFKEIKAAVKAPQKQALMEYTHGEAPSAKVARQFGASFRAGYAEGLKGVVEISYPHSFIAPAWLAGAALGNDYEV